MGNPFLAKKLATLPFMKVNPVFSGGDITRSYSQDSLVITVYKPVFESLIGSSNHGFVQVKLAGVNQLPQIIHCTIDYDADSKADFCLNINTASNETKLESLNPLVTAINVSSRVKNYWVVRVNLEKNTRR